MEGNENRCDWLSQVTFDYLAERVRAAGHPFFDQGDFNLNLVGIRTEDTRSELFNDWLLVAYRQNDHEQLQAFQITTDPGIYWREHPMNVDGTAILAPGHHKQMFRLGRHQGKYPAMVQASLCTVYRDNDRNALLDMREDTKQTGFFGINMHRAGDRNPAHKVGKWSAGCQVFQSTADFEFFLAIIGRASVLWGDRFSYTLLTEQELWP